MAEIDNSKYIGDDQTDVHIPYNLDPRKDYVLGENGQGKDDGKAVLCKIYRAEDINISTKTGKIYTKKQTIEWNGKIITTTNISLNLIYNKYFSILKTKFNNEYSSYFIVDGKTTVLLESAKEYPYAEMNLGVDKSTLYQGKGQSQLRGEQIKLVTSSLPYTQVDIKKKLDNSLDVILPQFNISNKNISGIAYPSLFLGKDQGDNYTLGNNILTNFNYPRNIPYGGFGWNEKSYDTLYCNGIHNNILQGKIHFSPKEHKLKIYDMNHNLISERICFEEDLILIIKTNITYDTDSYQLSPSTVYNLSNTMTTYFTQEYRNIFLPNKGDLLRKALFIQPYSNDVGDRYVLSTQEKLVFNPLSLINIESSSVTTYVTAQEFKEEYIINFQTAEMSNSLNKFLLNNGISKDSLTYQILHSHLHSGTQVNFTINNQFNQVQDAYGYNSRYEAFFTVGKGAKGDDFIIDPNQKFNITFQGRDNMKGPVPLDYAGNNLTFNIFTPKLILTNLFSGPNEIDSRESQTNFTIRPEISDNNNLYQKSSFIKFYEDNLYGENPSYNRGYKPTIEIPCVIQYTIGIVHKPLSIPVKRLDSQYYGIDLSAYRSYSIDVFVYSDTTQRTQIDHGILTSDDSDRIQLLDNKKYYMKLESDNRLKVYVGSTILNTQRYKVYARMSQPESYLPIKSPSFQTTNFHIETANNGKINFLADVTFTNPNPYSVGLQLLASDGIDYPYNNPVTIAAGKSYTVSQVPISAYGYPPDLNKGFIGRFASRTDPVRYSDPVEPSDSFGD